MIFLRLARLFALIIRLMAQYQQLLMNSAMDIDHSSTTHNSEPSSDNYFLLRGTESTYLQQEIFVDFEPVKAIDPEITPQRLTTFSIIPTFNPDGKYYTTAFLNPFDDEMEDDDKMITQHQSRVKEYSTEIAEDDILLPKPRNANPYCCVCKQTCNDYLEHINTGKHQRSMKNSRWTKLIENLADSSFPKVRRSRRITKGK